MGSCCSTSSTTSRTVSGPKSLQLFSTSKVPVARPIVSLTKTTYNTFVELILINRILFGKESDKETAIGDIILQLNDESKREECETILNQLCNHNINQYMKKYYDDSQCSSIEIIFHDIIMKNYINECEDQVTMQLNNDKNEFECLLFNQNDLIPQIFQYLDLDSLSQSSLVNFVWLYHAFNVNSLYYLPFSKLFCWEHDGTNYLALTVWQRLINARKIEYETRDYIFSFDQLTISNRFLTHFASLQNIEKVVCYFDDFFTKKDLSFIEILSKSNTGKKIRHFRCVLFGPRISSHVGVDQDDESKLIDHIANLKSLPTLKLYNASSINLRTVALPFICSDQCESLSLNDLKFTHKFCQSLIDDSDLTGIKKLEISDLSGLKAAKDEVRLLENVDTTTIVGNNIEDIASVDIFKVIGQKMDNIERLRISGTQNDTLEFIQALTPIILKNNSEICLCIKPPKYFDLHVAYNDFENQARLVKEAIKKQENLFNYVIKSKMNVVKVELELDEDGMVVTKQVLNNKHIYNNIEFLGLSVWTSLGLTPKEKRSDLEVFVQDFMMKECLFMEDEKARDNYGDDADNYKNDGDDNVTLNVTKHKFDKLKQINCDFICGDLNFGDLQALNQFLQLKFHNNNNDESTLFWRVNCKMRWPEDINLAMKNDYEMPEKYVEKANMIDNLSKIECAYVSWLNDCMKEMFANIDELFIEKQKPIEFILSIMRYHWDNVGMLKSQMIIKEMKGMFNRFFQKSFAAQFDQYNCQSSLTVQNQTQYYKIPKGNEYCTPLKEPQIMAQISQTRLKTSGGSCHTIKFVVKTALYNEKMLLRL